ncbi:MAG: hypothetical protein ACFFDW_15305 [Candidatus Thorarchaeota archaeon]
MSNVCSIVKIILDILASKLTCEMIELEELIQELIFEERIKGELKNYIGEFHIKKYQIKKIIRNRL